MPRPLRPIEEGLSDLGDGSRIEIGDRDQLPAPRGGLSRLDQRGRSSHVHL